MFLSPCQEFAFTLVARARRIPDQVRCDRGGKIGIGADELAFLAMECEHAGAAFIGSVLFETYRQCSGDDPPRLLVCFYKAYRAQMRAKLSIKHLGSCDYGDADKWVQRTKAYLRLAARFAGELHG